MRGKFGMALIGVAVATGAVAAEWPQWRGPDRDGISSEQGWLKDGAAPRTVWEASVGSGYSSVAVKGGKLYTMGNSGDTDSVLCFDAVKGTQVWKQSYPCGGGGYPGPRATPTVDGKSVFTLSREGLLLCLDADSGTITWKRDIKSDMGVAIPQWGFASSPLVLDKSLIVNVGRHGLAVDKRTGKTLWESGKDGASYAAVVAVNRGGTQTLLVFAAKGLVSVDAATGAKQWEFPWKTSYDVNAPDPVACGDKVLLTSGYGRGGALLQMGAGAPKVLWETKTLASHFASPVFWKDCIYGVTGNTGGGEVCCVDPASGQAKWTSKDAGFCALTLADGKLVLLNEHGTLKVADAVPDGYHERLSAKVLDGTCWTAPVVSGGLVYVRNDKGHLLALDLTGKPATP